MKKLTVLYLSPSLVMTAALLSGCGSTKDAVDNVSAAVGANELQHSWVQNNCDSSLGLNLVGPSRRVVYEFSGKNVKKTEQYFSSPNCQDQAASVTYTGTFEKKDEVKKDVHQINLNFNRALVTATSDQGVKTLNGLQFCGKKDWVIGVESDLSTASRGALCPLSTLPEATYDIYTVDKDTLIFGDRDSTTPDKRPTDLNPKQSFVKS